jgi:cystathionine beta-lyase
VWICSDEIWCDLLLTPRRHIPIASIDPEVAERTITLMAPSKTFNVPAMGYAFAVVPNRALHTLIDSRHSATYASPNVLGYYGALAAYTQCAPWRDALIEYLTANRDLVVDHASKHWPGAALTRPDATYLAWIDLTATGLGPEPHIPLETTARVAVSEGVRFGPGYEHYIRLNFACPRPLLREILHRMDAVLS